ncbi:Hypothetical protein CINCED_3A003974 [Cinara cedri]|uniref:Uncharacterized protein n=1 Tax=Cinara cedri TaxID=506608 RepID=A0A5E4M9A2_9HEMI|nr:Hypothetical protein CINCED_3A003974 [Cinara cedri]
MAKFRKKLKSKGKRWVKGQSSVTNPDSKKYRSQAQMNFCKPMFGGISVNEGHNALTQNKLKQHDNIMNSDDSNKSKPDDVISQNSGASYKTFETFASDWSSCTNPSFNRLLRNFSSNSSLHKEMLAILAALTEVIQVNGGKETSTEYFAALITTLQTTLTNGQDDCEESITAMVSLLSMGIKCVPKEVLCAKFGPTTQILLSTLAKFAESDNNNLLKSVFSCLSLVLRVQEKIVWSHSSTVQVFDAILNFVVHSKPKIRKAAQHSVCAILKSNKDFMHPMAGYTASYCTKVLTSSTTSNTTTILHILTLLKELMPVFPKKELKPLCEEILKLMTLNHPLLLSCGFQVFHGLFASYPSSEFILTSTLNAKLLIALFDYRPTSIDTQPTLAWLTVQKEAYICLSKSDLSLCISHLKKVFKICIELWITGNPECIKASGSTLRILIEDCIGQATDLTYHPCISGLFNLVTQCLSYKYKNACPQVLHTLSTFFKVYGNCAPNIFLECVKSLGQLRDSNEITFVNELEMTIGAAIKYIGPEYIISDQIIPLKVDDVGEFKRSWLLPVLKNSISNSTLKCFINQFLPLALKCREMYEKALISNDKISGISYDLLESQIWSLLVSFCSNPSDISTSFQNIAKTMGVILSSRKELRDTILLSLRKLIDSTSKNDEPLSNDKKQLAHFAKNFLPICFNVYTNPVCGTDEEATKFSALETIKMYLTICDDNLKEKLFNKCCGMLDDSKNAEPIVLESILDIIRVLVPYQSVETLKTFYDTRIFPAMYLKNFKEEKKYFRILEEISSSKTPTCNTFVKENVKSIQSFLSSTAKCSAATSRGPRLRCLAHLLDNIDQKILMKIILAHLPEAVLCCKGSTVNKRCRECAFSLINKMALLVIKTNKNFDEFLTALSAGLDGSVQMISCTILALASVLHNFKSEINPSQFEVILSNVCLLLTTSTRQIVSCALSFIKVITSSFYNKLLPYLSKVVISLTDMRDDCKRKFRQETKNIYQRLVRKFGSQDIIKFVPNTDLQTHVRLRAIIKNSERLKKKDKTKKKANNDKFEIDPSFKIKPKTFEEILAECEEDDNTLEPNSNRKHQTNQEKGRKQKLVKNYLHESEDDILDFTESSTNRNILLSKPINEQFKSGLRQSKADDGIKTAPDGRLIIVDDNLKPLPKSTGIDDDNIVHNDSDDEMPSKKRIKYTRMYNLRYL